MPPRLTITSHPQSIDSSRTEVILEWVCPECRRPRVLRVFGATQIKEKKRQIRENPLCASCQRKDT